MIHRHLFISLTVVVGAFSIGWAQPPVPNAPAARQPNAIQSSPNQQNANQPDATQTPPKNIQLTLGDEVEISTLVDYVSRLLKVRILYDEQLANKKITIRAPGNIPTETMLDVLQSALKMKGLVLVDAEAKGWKRIAQEIDLSRISNPGEAAKIPEIITRLIKKINAV